MDSFVRVLAASDVPAGQCKEARVGERKVAVYNVDGTFYATANQCPHRGGPLGQGWVEGSTILCPWHGWSFHLESGVNTENPDVRVQTYPVRVEQGDVFVQLD